MTTNSSLNEKLKVKDDPPKAEVQGQARGFAGNFCQQIPLQDKDKLLLPNDISFVGKLT